MKENIITGIILAGGESQRMGEEKGLVRFRGKPLIEYAVENLQKFTHDIIISANNQTYNYLGYTVFQDVYPNCGPMGGIYSCLLQSKSELAFVLSCDIPAINKGLVQYLIQSYHKEDVLVPTLDKVYPEPLCGIYHKNSAQMMLPFIQAKNYKLPDFFRTVNSRIVFIDPSLPFFHPYLFYNVNSKKNLRELERLNF